MGALAIDRIVQGDCREVLAQMPEGSMDMLEVKVSALILGDTS